MARAYNARTIALTVGQPIKWVDNLLSHHALPGVTRSRQGVQRRVSDEGLLAVELTRILTLDLGVSISRAVELTRTALGSRQGTDVRLSPGSGVTLTLHASEIEERLRQRVIDAIESVARVRRGRPPKVRARSDR
jgi:hypothetical protein